MKVEILTDPSSWFNDHLEKFSSLLISELGFDVCIILDHKKITACDVRLILSYLKIVPTEILNSANVNLVIHASSLPQGKGMSPLSWQILEGKNDIPLTLFEAVEKVDSGPIFKQVMMKFDGTELIDEMRDVMTNKMVDMLRSFFSEYPNNVKKEQVGEEFFYGKRTPLDSEIDINKSIAEQFNLLRICDNEKYPAFFYFKSKKYILKIEAVND